MDIENKIAIVTGSARGIGRATALALADAGARAVIIADLRHELAAEAAEEVRTHGADAIAFNFDVADLDGWRKMILETADRFGGLHILHNNAGIGEGAAEWPGLPSERAAAIVDVNLRAVVLGTQLALPLMQRSGGGAIVNTASGAAFNPVPPQAVYAATKAGVVHFTKSCVALEASHGVRVSAVCPGLVETDMIQESGRDGPSPWLQPIIDSVEMLRPEDIAERVTELVRDPKSAGKIVSVENEPRNGNS